MTTKIDTEFLANVPLFSKLTANELDTLASLLKPRNFPASELVMLIGEEGSEFHILQSGKVEVSQPDESGQEVRLAELGPGHFFGEISLLDDGPRTATVRAISDVTVLTLERSHFVSFLIQYPSAAVHILTVLGARQRDLLEKLRGIRNVNEAVGGKESALLNTLSKVAGVFASEKFLLGNLLLFLTWIVVHSFLYRHLRPNPVDFVDAPPTFFWLGFIVTLESIIIGMFVLNSQRRQAERDRVRADLEYQVNVKAHMEVMELHRKVDKLLAGSGTKKEG